MTKKFKTFLITILSLNLICLIVVGILVYNNFLLAYNTNYKVTEQEGRINSISGTVHKIENEMFLKRVLGQ